MAQIDTNANINFKRDKSYFMEKKTSQVKMLEIVVIGNISGMLSGRCFFQQIVRIPMAINCAPLFID